MLLLALPVITVALVALLMFDRLFPAPTSSCRPARRRPDPLADSF